MSSALRIPGNGVTPPAGHETSGSNSALAKRERPDARGALQRNQPAQRFATGRNGIAGHTEGALSLHRCTALHALHALQWIACIACIAVQCRPARVAAKMQRCNPAHLGRGNRPSPYACPCFRPQSRKPFPEPVGALAGFCDAIWG
jgi:hypothetical protein